MPNEIQNTQKNTSLKEIQNTVQANTLLNFLKNFFIVLNNHKELKRHLTEIFKPNLGKHDKKYILRKLNFLHLNKPQEMLKNIKTKQYLRNYLINYLSEKNTEIFLTNLEFLAINKPGKLQLLTHRFEYKLEVDSFYQQSNEKTALEEFLIRSIKMINSKDTNTLFYKTNEPIEGYIENEYISSLNQDEIEETGADESLLQTSL